MPTLVYLPLFLDWFDSFFYVILIFNLLQSFNEAGIATYELSILKILQIISNPLQPFLLLHAYRPLFACDGGLRSWLNTFMP